MYVKQIHDHSGHTNDLVFEVGKGDEKRIAAIPADLHVSKGKEEAIAIVVRELNAALDQVDPEPKPEEAPAEDASKKKGRGKKPAEDAS